MQLKALDVQAKWRSEDIDVVISFYKDHPQLWDSSIVEYRDRTARNIGLEELVRLLSYRKTGSKKLPKIATKIMITL